MPIKINLSLRSLKISPYFTRKSRTIVPTLRVSRNPDPYV
ncbi:hypothetical protein NIES2104_52500 [Leptolyngbya sp. NIES-2104]|nr:hypothetical protein NIES2104_52500 [Leptolyngbya sp. NIES-2104]